MKKEIHFSEINKQKRYAVNLIKSGEMPKNPNDLLVYLSASTFLNACAKLPEYKKNKGFLYGSGTFKIDNGHYVYNYDPCNPTYGAKIECEVKCEEAVTVQYGAPVASKAGLCFEYKVKVTSRV